MCGAQVLGGQQAFDEYDWCSMSPADDDHAVPSPSMSWAPVLRPSSIADLAQHEGRPIFRNPSFAVPVAAVGIYGAATRPRTRLRTDVQGRAMAVVKVNLDGGQTITSSITKEAVLDLELAEGKPVTVLVKPTELTLGVG